MASSGSSYTNPNNPRAFFDLSIGGKDAARVTFELFADVVPRTAANFLALCTGAAGASPISRVPLHYKGSVMHRIIPGFMAQGGDFTRGDGTGGESIYGAKFADESFRMRHDGRGVLSMANAGPGTNASQFFVTFAAAPFLDGKHVVFGRVVDGMGVLQQLERVLTGKDDRPRQPVTIVNCGDVSDASSSASGGVSTSSGAAGPLRGGRASHIDPNAMGLPAAFGSQRARRTLPDAESLPPASAAGPHSDTKAVESELTALLRAQAAEHDAGGASSRSTLSAGITGRIFKADGSDLTMAVAPITRTCPPVSETSPHSEKVVPSGRSAAAAAAASPARSHADDAEGDTGDDADVNVGVRSVDKNSSSASAAIASVPAPKSAVAARLFALHMKMNEARKENHAQVVSEHTRLAAAAVQQGKGADRVGVKRVRRDGADGDDGSAVDGSGTANAAQLLGAPEKSGDEHATPGASAAVPRTLHQSAAAAAAAVQRSNDKESRRLANYGWNAFNDDARFAAYERRVARVVSSGTTSRVPAAPAPVAPGISWLSSTADGAALALLQSSGGAAATDPAGLERMVAELKETEARREGRNAARARSLKGGGAADNGGDHINEDNRRFIRAASRSMDPYTVGIRQNLERGTAL